MGVSLLPRFIRVHYEVHEYKHACSILRNDFPSEWADLISLLTAFRLKKSWIDTGGGRKSQVAIAIDTVLLQKDWIEKDFSTQLVVDGNVTTVRL